jgi:hypothetical protein
MAQWFRVTGNQLEYIGAEPEGMYKNRSRKVGDPFDTPKQAKACLKAIPKDYDVEYLEKDPDGLFTEFKLWHTWYRDTQVAPKDPVYVAWIEVVSHPKNRIEPRGLEVIAPNYGIYKTEQTVPTNNTTQKNGYKGCTVNYVEPREELYATERKTVWRHGIGLVGAYVDVDEPIRNADGKILEKATGEPFPEYSAKVAWSHYRPHMSLPGSADNYTLYALYELSSGYRLALLPRKDIKEFLKLYATWELLEDTGAKRTYKKDNHTITLKHKVKIEVTQ